MKRTALRIKNILGAVLLVGVAAAPALLGHAAAYTAAVTSRSVTMSSSAPSATANYTVGFTETGTSIIKSVVVDFCAESPVYGAACTVPAGMTTTAATLAGQTGTSGWTLTKTTNGHWLFAGATANTATGISFTVNTVTNPSIVGTGGNNAAGTFYARIYTYAAQAPDYTNVTAPGTVLDFGGDALSTAAAFTVSATVQETLKFCVYSSTCGDTPAITLGHTSGGVTVLDNSAIDWGAVKFDVSSNANGNVAINLYGDTLKNGTVSSIPDKPTAGSLTAGTAGFCLYLTPGANVTAQNSYGTATTACKLDSTSTKATGGQKIAQATAQTTTTSTTVTYGATAATTTPAGVYSANHQLIAIGTY